MLSKHARLRPKILGSAQSFDFMDRIPAEIRSEIYEHLLVARSPLQVVLFENDAKLQQAKMAIRIGMSGRSASDFLMQKKTEGIRIPTEAERLAITRVSKQVLQEVTPIIYGKHKFEFHEADALAKFLGKINNNTMYLRQLALPSSHGWNISFSSLNFERLALATNLTKLEVNADAFYKHALSANGKISVKDFLAQFKSFLGALVKSKEQAREKKSTLDVIDVATQHTPLCSVVPGNDDCFCPRDKYMTPVRREAHAENVRELIRAGVAGELGVDPEG